MHRRGRQRRPRSVQPLQLPPLLALGALHDPALMERIARGEHPDVEYRILLDSKGFELFDFGADDASAWSRRMRSMLGDYWFTAVSSAWREGSDRVILATGEDVGLRIAMLQQLVKLPGSRAGLAIICHGSYLRSPHLARVLWLLRRRRDVRYLCLSTSIAEQFVAAGARRTQVIVVGYGVDTAFFAPDPDAGWSGVVAAGTASRDYRTLLDAVAGMAVDVRIAADSTWFPEALDIDATAVPANVDVRSAGGYVELRRLYAGAGVVVVPLYDSRHAAGYAVIVEAMAMGKPVVSTRIRGQSDFIDSGVNGYLVEAGDSAAMREIIEHLLADPQHAMAIGTRARESVLAHSTVELYAERLSRATYEMVELRPARRQPGRRRSTTEATAAT